MENQNSSIDSTLNAYYQKIEERGYKPGTIHRFHSYAETFRAWCNNKGIETFSEDVAVKFCKEQLGAYVFTKNMSNTQKDILRTIRMIAGLYSNGDFEIRGPQKEYEYKTDIAEHIKWHLESYVSKKSPSASSYQNRMRIISIYDNYLYEQGLKMTDVNPRILEDFFSSPVVKSRKTYKTHIREFYRSLYSEGIVDVDYSAYIQKEPQVCSPVKLPTTYSEKEIKQIISAIDRGSANGKRAYLVTLLAAEYGLRASDIINLRFSQIDWEKNIIHIIQEKTGNPVDFPLLTSVGNAIIEYLKNGRPETSHDIIIVRHDTTFRGMKVSNSLVFNIVSDAIRKANIKDWRNKKHGPHSLRHSLASNLLNHGVSLPTISTILGHKTTETTKMYIKVDIEKLRLCCLPIPAISSDYYHTK